MPAFPAISVALTSAELEPRDRGTVQPKLEPLRVAGTPLHITPAMPERVSVREPDIDCEATATVLPLAGEAMAIAGAVLSSLTVTEPEAVLPAL